MRTGYRFAPLRARSVGAILPVNLRRGKLLSKSWAQTLSPRQRQAAFSPFARRLPRMAQHPQPCEICTRIRDIQNHNHPGFIAELPTGYAVLGDSQFFRGYTVFLCKTPAPDLEDLPHEARFQFLREMALVSEAVSHVVKPHKMNVESLGNIVPHLHFHLFPRFLSENEPQKPVWLVMPQGESAEKYALNAARDGALISAIRAEIDLLSV